MRRLQLRSALSLFAILALPALAHAGLLPDSTVIDGWRLPNGLEVRARHIPRAAGVAITLGFRAGSAYEPPHRAGLADLLAETELTAAAGAAPERSRDELGRLLPLGWDVRTNEQLALLTEVVTRQQYPGALHEMAARLRGVQLDAAELKTSVADVHADLARSWFGSVDLVLYHRLRAQALGTSDEQVVRRASARDLDGLTLHDVQAELQRLYVPANAVLAVSGDLSIADIRRLVESEFAAIPAGTAQPEAPTPTLTAPARTTSWTGIAERLAALGVIAPALSDSLHPAFYLGSLIIGAFMRDQWGPPNAPLTSRFQYSLFDEPDLVRFYPPVTGDTTTVGGLRTQFAWLMDRFSDTAVPLPLIESVRHSVSWLLGSPLPPELLQRTHTETGPLATLSTSMATRALWHGDTFWDAYRTRFETTKLGPNIFTDWISSPAHEPVLLLLPQH